MTPDIAHMLLAAVLTAALGAGGGWLYFRLLRLATDGFVAGGVARAAALTLARVCIAGLLFWSTAQLGAVPLLAAFAGFLLARRRATAAACKAGQGSAA